MKGTDTFFSQVRVLLFSMGGDIIGDLLLYLPLWTGLVLFEKNAADIYACLLYTSVEDTVEKVANAVLEMEGCPYEVQLNVLLTDNDGIHAYNKEYRNIDRETDVLSFPNLDFAAPGDFDIPEDREADYFDPDTGELILGDIIISVDRVREQAESYGHSRKREFAFLVAHRCSML